MLKNEKGKFFLSIIAVLACGGFLAWQGIVRVSADIEKNVSEVKDKKIFSKVYDLKKDSLPAETLDYNFSKSKIEEINDYFVYANDDDNMAFTSFFTELEDLAFKSTQKTNSLNMELYQAAAPSLKDKNKNPSPQASGAIDSRLLKLTLQSDYESLFKFISYLEAMPYYVYIESVSINANDAGRSQKDLSPVNNSVQLKSILIIKVLKKTNAL